MDDEEDEQLLDNAAAALSSLVKTISSILIFTFLHHVIVPNSSGNGNHRGRPPGGKNIYRKRAHLQQIFTEYGPKHFRKAYRMTEPSFWKLLDIIEKK